MTPGERRADLGIAHREGSEVTPEGRGGCFARELRELAGLSPVAFVKRRSTGAIERTCG